MPDNNIHEAILAVMKEVGYVQKEKKPGLNYTFAGEAALIEALRPSMIAHDIIMYVSDVRERNWTTYQTAKGYTMISTVLISTVVFLHVPSGTSIKVEAPGEGADTGDKSGNKAATGAYKYALRQTFMIETGDDPDKYSSEEQQPVGKVEQKVKKERMWSFEQFDAVLEHAAGITDNYEGAGQILDLSVLPEDSKPKTVSSWMGHFAKADGEWIARAAVANQAYMKAKGGK